jgi:hypothetical protein
MTTPHQPPPDKTRLTTRKIILLAIGVCAISLALIGLDNVMDTPTDGVLARAVATGG